MRTHLLGAVRTPVLIPIRILYAASDNPTVYMIIYVWNGWTKPHQRCALRVRDGATPALLRLRCLRRVSSVTHGRTSSAYPSRNSIRSIA